MEDYDYYLKYCDVNNSYGWSMSPKLPVNALYCVVDIYEFNEDSIESYDDESDEEFFLEIYFQYQENLYNFHNDLPFLPERIKTKKVEKLVSNLDDKTEYITHIRNLKQALNHK